ncbi:hypothetical protein LTR36_008394 [Oleoguttula mirabilis]|uniref:Phospholipid-transporting ATPase n=1 Tax=Oleoguttula mirabilis TaxID=1507867 RepID=A0AAV9J8E7_9PEZI|nr:hypothetical protein LTR36_008394 [Oleoguttula mirabilis]
MSGDAEAAGSNASGVRKRRSGQFDSDGAMSAADDGVQTGTRDATVDEQPQRVWFSGDHERPSSAGQSTTKKRQSDEMMQNTEDTNGARGRLSVDSRAAAVMSGGEIEGGPIVGCPPDIATSSAPPPRRTPLKSRKSRNRGLSLRSSLFTRNVDLKVHNPASVIEMQPVKASNSDSTAKKSSQPSVTVTSVVETGPSPPPIGLPAAGKGDQGVSALPNYQQWVQRQASRHLPLKRAKEVCERIRKYLLHIHDIPPSKHGRQIPLDASRQNALVDERTEKAFIGNLIRSSKYTPWNFVPRQLFAQFSKLANFYFLIVATLQMIPGLSTTGTYTTIAPLLFFVSISMAKEGYEDVRRYRLDKAENNHETRVLRVHRPVAGDTKDDAANQGKPEYGEPEGPNNWVSVKWHSLRVGDVVKLNRDDAAPADLVLLKSNGPNNVAYIETMALDGETNLKSKQPPAALVGAYSSMEAIAAGEAHFVVEDPNLDLYNFEGKVTTNGETAPLTNDAVIYRGSVLRNTPETIGMVVYSGEECKIRMNANKNPRIKAPSLQATVNKIVVIIVIFVIFLALFNTIAYQVWREAFEEKAWYLTSASVSFGPILTSFIIMFNTMVPLSLYVSLEIIKVAQMLLMADVDMYDEPSNTPFEARTSTINEELGQVSYVFSDKTGTLTENVMRFRKLSVAGTAWSHQADLEGQPESDNVLMHKKRKPKGKGKMPLRRLLRKSTSHDDGAPYSDAVLDGNTSTLDHAKKMLSTAAAAPVVASMSTEQMIRYIQRRPQTAFARKAKLMILSMALCHTCLPERDRDDDDSITYQASSPDELALVNAARELGYVAYDRAVSTLTLKVYPNGWDARPVYETFEVLDIIEFSSKRKRMSVIVRFPDGRVCLMCKGADSAVMQTLRLAALAREKLAHVEKRVRQRQSMEARQVLQRKSSQLETNTSYPRTSQQLSRPSVSRPSFGRLGSIRDEVDEWLNDRETDVVASPVDENFYTPRPSAQYDLRPSMAASEQTGSLYTDYDDEELVEDALAVDEAVVIERCFQHINDFATEGLRTLLYGYRFLDDEEYTRWKKVYHDATTSLVDRQKLVEAAGEMIEQQLELGGATAIEDKLQQGVPETIDRLRRANIKIWMLTGDKRETAINIGLSCRLIKDYSSVTVLDCEAGNVAQNIAASIIDINRGGVAHSVIVVDGQTLSAIDADKSLHVLFLDLAILADSVVCCRASPSQKAGLVGAIRKRVKRSVTLAIGDGANDIAMIQEAHVGIGITGKEGLQAARTSDYSIAQFRFLTKLLLVHGRWNYVRTCKYTVGTFWKEMLFYLTQALYQQYAGYTGTSLYESWSLSMFNTLFTSLVVIFLGIFEQDLHASTLIAVPELYTKGQRSGGFNLKVYLGWMFMAVSEAMIVFFTMWGLYGTAIFALDQSLYPMGDMTFTACVIIIATKLQIIEQRNRTYMALIGWILAVGGWFLWNIILAGIYSSTTNPEYYVKGGFYTGFGRSALWWLTLLLTVVACLAFEVGVRALKNAFLPTDVEIFQTLEQDLGTRKRFEEASAPWLQAGWDHGSKQSSLELQREAEEQAVREGEVQELLDRPRVMEEGRSHKSGVRVEAQAVIVDDGLG